MRKHCNPEHNYHDWNPMSKFISRATGKLLLESFCYCGARLTTEVYEEFYDNKTGTSGEEKKE